MSCEISKNEYSSLKSVIIHDVYWRYIFLLKIETIHIEIEIFNGQ